MFLEPDNFIPADPLVTPIHIKPVWYFTPFYAILKAVPDKLMGVVMMGASVASSVLPALARPLTGQVHPLQGASGIKCC